MVALISNYASKIWSVSDDTKAQSVKDLYMVTEKTH